MRAEFEKAGLPAFVREREAMLALKQLAEHAELMRREHRKPGTVDFPELEKGNSKFLDEAQSLALLAAVGLPVVEHRLCRSEDEARAAFAALGPKVVLKACSASVPHKTELGLVRLGLQSEAEVLNAYQELKSRIPEADGVLVARHATGRRELALGARVDPSFGPVVLVGDGGIYLEALKDFQLLLPPFGEREALAALARLRIAPLLSGARPSMAVQLGDAMLGSRGRVASIDVNPVMLYERGGGALAVDALVETAPACAELS